MPKIRFRLYLGLIFKRLQIDEILINYEDKHDEGWEELDQIFMTIVSNVDAL